MSSQTTLLLLFVLKTQFAGVPNAVFTSKSTSRGCKSEASGFASLLPEDVRLLQQADCMLLAVGGESHHREERKED